MYIYNLLSFSSIEGKSRSLSGTEGLLSRLEYHLLGSENVEEENQLFSTTSRQAGWRLC